MLPTKLWLVDCIFNRKKTPIPKTRPIWNAGWTWNQANGVVLLLKLLCIHSEHTLTMRCICIKGCFSSLILDSTVRGSCLVTFYCRVSFLFIHLRFGSGVQAMCRRPTVRSLTFSFHPAFISLQLPLFVSLNYFEMLGEVTVCVCVYCIYVYMCVLGWSDPRLLST